MTKLTVSVSEAVAITGIGRTRIYELIKSNQLQPRKLGRRTLFLVKELEHFVTSLPRSNEE